MNAVGRYEIVRRIGVGGMGEVFFAWAYGVARTRKPVVVKVLRGEMLAEPGAPEMFVEEGRLSLRLSHSNILQVFDFGKADDRYFMAMEYVDGYHLGELRKRNGGRLAPEQAAFVTMEVCLALDYAHRLKDEAGESLHIVHRDVTPSNILISREGEVKLADFGIARAVGRSQHTQAGQIRGKVRYMAPEAARGEPLDHRADLFSLGAILFELLTGQRAFEGKGREAILQQVVGSRVPPPSSVSADVPPALDDVVIKATAPKREDRFADAFAMHRALEGACRKAGLSPSRGSFLEFLRELDSSVVPVDESRAAAEVAPARAAAPRSGRTSSGPVGRLTPSVPEPSPASMPTPASSTNPRGAVTPSGARGAVAPQQSPEAGATAAVAPPTMGGTPGSALPPAATRGTRDSERAANLSGSAPSASASKPSSSTGSVPPPVKGPDTALPTGVASPVVLFTLTVAGEMTPDFPGAEVSDLPRFEVTRGEGVPVDFRDVERITPKGEQDSLAKSREESEFSNTPEPLFPDRPSNSSAESTIVREPTNPSAPLMGEPSGESTLPPGAIVVDAASEISGGARQSPSRTGSAAAFEVPVDMPLAEDTRPPERTPIPRAPANEPTIAPVSAAETTIRERPSLDEPGPTLASASVSGSGSGSGSRSVSVSVSVSARSVRARSTSGQVPRAGLPVSEEPPTGDTGRSRETDASRDTIDHVDEPAVVKIVDAIDESGKWRRRGGELAPEPPDLDLPALRRRTPKRNPVVLGAVVILVILLGWLGAQVIAGGKTAATPTPRPTPFTMQTARPVPTATPAAPTATPLPTQVAVQTAPVRTPLVIATPPPPTRTPVAVATTPRPTPTARPATPRPTPTPAPTAVAAVQYGFLLINSQPWSEVRLNGKLLGNTPMKNVRLPVGRHTLVFKNPVSGLEKSVDVDVSASDNKPVLVELK